MEKIEKIAHILRKIAYIFIALGITWMTIQTIYGVGRAKGYVEAREECIMLYEGR